MAQPSLSADTTAQIDAIGKALDAQKVCMAKATGPLRKSLAGKTLEQQLAIIRSQPDWHYFDMDLGNTPAGTVRFDLRTVLHRRMDDCAERYPTP